ncbi:MAG: SAM-dependent methyltransferase [Flavobacteriales bacterium]|nr:SAM-dependent methyltransferase [Flavobacteriales bacterium]|tara:strand:+ start:1039 stop:1770 length:732 start_codon:yes stop_codon:yes gene_type:complete
MSREWFESWFNTKYYHILYKNRDYSEAEKFISKLIDFLGPEPDAKFVDIACGKGRHSIFINKLGYDVVGYDLSEESILEANKSAKNDLKFYTHDMRQIFRTNYFDFALNLFTSFGYFKNKRDELNAIKASAKNLKKNGILVIDFLNRDKVIKNLVVKETKTVGGINFKISKEIKNNKIIKSINFSDDGNQYSFQECVKLLSLTDFKSHLRQVNLKITHTFGSYNLDEFKNTSDRLIIIAKKIG